MVALFMLYLLETVRYPQMFFLLFPAARQMVSTFTFGMFPGISPCAMWRLFVKEKVKPVSSYGLSLAG